MMRCVLVVRRFRRGAHMVWSWTGDPAWLGAASTEPFQTTGPLPQNTGPLSLVLGPDGVTVLYHDGHHACPFDDVGAVLDALGPKTPETEGLADAAYRFLVGDAS